MSQVPRPRRRFLLRTLAVLFVLAGALLVGLRFYLSSRAAARRVADALEDMLGMPVEVESARIGLFGSSTIRRLRIYESADDTVMTKGRSVAAVKNASSQSKTQRCDTTAIGGTGRCPRARRACCTSSGSAAGP